MEIRLVPICTTTILTLYTGAAPYMGHFGAKALKGPWVPGTEGTGFT